MSQYQIGDTVYELFSVPVGSTVLSSRVYLAGVNVTQNVVMNQPALIAGNETTHDLYTVSYVVPNTAQNRQVYQLVVDWKDDQEVLQCPIMTEAQVVVSPATSDLVEISKG